MPMYETQLMDEYFAAVSGVVCVSLMASHLICGRTNLLHNCIVNQVTKRFVTLAVAFDPPMHHDTIYLCNLPIQLLLNIKYLDNN